MSFFTVSPTIAEDTELCRKISALQNDAAYFVAYGKENGQPIAIIEALGFEVVKEGKHLPFLLMRLSTSWISLANVEKRMWI